MSSRAQKGRRRVPEDSGQGASKKVKQEPSEDDVVEVEGSAGASSPAASSLVKEEPIDDADTGDLGQKAGRAAAKSKSKAANTKGKGKAKAKAKNKKAGKAAAAAAAAAATAASDMSDEDSDDEDDSDDDSDDEDDDDDDEDDDDEDASESDDEDDAGDSDDSGVARTTDGEKWDLKKLEKRFLAICDSKPEGARDSDVQKELPNVPSQLRVDMINRLLRKGRLLLFMDRETNMAIYKAVPPEKMEQFRGLGPPDMLLYQLIEKEQNMGIWIRDLRRRSNLKQPTITKVLKKLMSRKLIKCERSIAGKNKKVYMLYELEPAVEVTGGAWYQGHTLDQEFFEIVYTATHRLIRDQFQGKASASMIREHMQRKGAFKTNISTADLASMLKVMCYDGVIEEVPPHLVQFDGSVDASSSQDGSKRKSGRSSKKIKIEVGGGGGDGRGGASSSSSSPQPQETYYRLIQGGPFASESSSIPCSLCPVQDRCHETGPITPSSCAYLRDFMFVDF